MRKGIWTKQKRPSYKISLGEQILHSLVGLSSGKTEKNLGTPAISDQSWENGDGY